MSPNEQNVTAVFATEYQEHICLWLQTNNFASDILYSMSFSSVNITKSTNAKGVREDIAMVG